jgi:hypothetical protein
MINQERDREQRQRQREVDGWMKKNETNTKKSGRKNIFNVIQI